MLARLLGWVGMGAMMFAPPFIDSDAGKLLAIFALICLTGQAISIRMYNLIILNLTGIIGYAYAIYI